MSQITPKLLFLAAAFKDHFIYSQKNYLQLHVCGGKA